MEALAQWRGYNWPMGPGMMDWGYGGSWLGHIMGIVLWIAVIVGIIFLVRWLVSSARGASREGGAEKDTALEILRKRYARGEIDKAEFAEKKKDLTG